MADTQPLNPSLQEQTPPLPISKGPEEISSGAPATRPETTFNPPAKLQPALERLASTLIRKSGQPVGKEGLSLTNARAVLGDQTLDGLAGSLSLTGGLRRKLKGYRFQGLAFWEHAVATANLAWELGRALDYPNPVQAYAAGLIHDIGKIFLEPYVEGAYSQIVELMWKEKLFLWQGEGHVFGLDHPATGGHPCERRKRPDPISEAGRRRHPPAFATPHTQPAAPAHPAPRRRGSPTPLSPAASWAARFATGRMSWWMRPVRA